MPCWQEYEMGNRVLGVGYSLAAEDDYGFRTLGSRLDEAEKLGVDFVELPVHSMDLIAGGRVLPERVKIVRDILAGRSLRYTVHGPLAINLMDVPERLPRHQDVLKASLDIASELGGLHYVLHCGVVPAARMANVEDLFAQQREILSAFGDEAGQRGLIIAVENLFTSDKTQVTALPSRLAREIAALAHPHIWACLDFSHAYINTTLHGASYIDEVAALSSFAKHLHLHDSFGRPPEFLTPRRAERLAYGEGDLHLPLGLGNIPWDRLMERLDFPGGVVFNIELPAAYWADLAEVIAKARALAAQARTGAS
jgi:sugar phosphate isomerase/epimerase